MSLTKHSTQYAFIMLGEKNPVHHTNNVRTSSTTIDLFVSTEQNLNNTTP